MALQIDPSVLRVIHQSLFDQEADWDTGGYHLHCHLCARAILSYQWEEHALSREHIKKQQNRGHPHRTPQYQPQNNTGHTQTPPRNTTTTEYHPTPQPIGYHMPTPTYQPPLANTTCNPYTPKLPSPPQYQPPQCHDQSSPQWPQTQHFVMSPQDSSRPVGAPSNNPGSSNTQPDFYEDQTRPKRPKPSWKATTNTNTTDGQWQNTDWQDDTWNKGNKNQTTHGQGWQDNKKSQEYGESIGQGLRGLRTQHGEHQRYLETIQEQHAAEFNKMLKHYQHMAEEQNTAFKKLYNQIASNKDAQDRAYNSFQRQLSELKHTIATLKESVPQTTMSIFAPPPTEAATSPTETNPTDTPQGQVLSTEIQGSVATPLVTPIEQSTEESENNTENTGNEQETNDNTTSTEDAEPTTHTWMWHRSW